MSGLLCGGITVRDVAARPIVTQSELSTIGCHCMQLRTPSHTKTRARVLYVEQGMKTFVVS